MPCGRFYNVRKDLLVVALTSLRGTLSDNGGVTLRGDDPSHGSRGCTFWPNSCDRLLGDPIGKK